jgi:type VI protein secretion system component VasK
MTIYSPSAGSTAGIDLILFNGATVAASGTPSLSNWTIQGIGTKSVNWTPANATILIQTAASYTAQSAMTGYAAFHFTADCRLGR